MPNSESVAAVHRSPVEVYEEFYKRYGAMGTRNQQAAGRLFPLLNGRVIHRDRSHDRSTHLIVHETAGNRVRTSLYRVDGEGRPYRHYNYDAAGFVVAMTDGVTISEWQLMTASGTHPGAVNAIDRPYRAELETLRLDLASPDGLRGRLELNRATGAGTLWQAGQELGWILDETASSAEKTLALQPVIPSQRSA
ncbi:MAG TPA: hypothetical protein VFH39_00660 [Candidatus Saccharimonadales bacterium]|nr:hypothetical protein [Candidatus Saccharimonadales bacterium]